MFHNIVCLIKLPGILTCALFLGILTGCGGQTPNSAPPNFVFFAPAPAVASFTPSGGTADTVVTITGSNLSGATAVFFNDTVATTIIQNDNTSVKVTVPAGASTGKIKVTTDGGTAVSADDYIVTPGTPFTIQ